MQRIFSLVAVTLVMVFLSFPLAAIFLWAAVFLLGYTPPFWLALVVLVGLLLNLLVLVGRRLHPSYRPRSS